MTMLDQITSSTGKRSKEANKGLAQEISDAGNRKAIKELVDLLAHKDKIVQSDAIEVLYETGYRNADLIADHFATFVELLPTKNNRLVWGAMIALSSISKAAPKKIFKELPRISLAMDKGSVITKDAGVLLYANLAAVKGYKEKVLPMLFDELDNCPEKQLAQYAEKSLVAIDKNSKDAFLEILSDRMKNIEKESQIKRLNKVIKKVEKIK